MSNAADVRLLYIRELRSALRERNIVINSILLPIFLYPLLLWLVYTGISFVGGQTEGFTSRVAIRNLPTEHASFRKELESDERFVLRSPDLPLEDLRNGDLDLLVEFSPAPAGTLAVPGNYGIRLTYDNSNDRSELAQDRVVEKISRYRTSLVTTEAGKLGISPQQLQMFVVEGRNVASNREMSQFILGMMLPLFLVIMLAVGCMYPAIDSTAGEREKSTWETVMTLATRRSNVVIAKYLYVATMSSVAGLLNLAAMLFSMKTVLAPLLGSDADELTFRIPMTAIPVILLVTVLLALFVAAGMMILASFARTFKEGQSLVSPFYISVFMPVMFLQVPGLELTPALALVPVVNVALVFREAVAGVFRWPLIGLTVLVEAASVALALWLAATILRYEDFLMGSYGGKFSKFVKERLIGRRRQGDLR
jgi:sodium transport system permease protein